MSILDEWAWASVVRKLEAKAESVAREENDG